MGKDIVVAMLHSLCKKGKYPPSLYSSFGLMITDETHRIAAESFVTLCNTIDAKLRLGLSATPDRKDGKEVLLHAHIGPVLVRTKLLTLTPKVLRFNTNWTCPRWKEKDPLTGQYVYRKVPHQAGKCMNVVKSLSKDKARNSMIVSGIATAYAKGRDIIVFSDLRDHLDELMSMSLKAGLPMKEMSLYVSGLTKDERETAKIKRLRYATYGMMAEGTDIPWADTAIFASPRSDVVQTAGRVLREFEGKKQPVIFDYIDGDSPVFKSYADSRLRFYNKIGSEILNIC